MHRLLLLFIASTLTACTPQTVPQTALPVPVSYQSGAAATLSTAALQTAELAQLQAEARNSNLDLQTLALHVAQSRQLAAIAQHSNDPQLGLALQAQRQRPSENGQATRMLDTLMPNNSQALIDQLSRPYNAYQAGFDARWELDIWGQNRQLTRQRRAEAAASAQALAGAQLSLQTELARYYWQWQAQRAQTALQQRLIELSEQQQQLLQTQRNNGLTTDLQIAPNRLDTAARRQQQQAMQQQLAVLERQLSLLLGRPVESLRPQAHALPELGESLTIDSAWVAQRPDLQQQQAQLVAASAEVAAARTQLYPAIELQAYAGFEALQTRALDAWGSRQWSIGPVLYLPLFNRGQIHRHIALTELKQQAAAIELRAKTLAAWHEVDIILAQLRALRDQRQTADQQQTLLNQQRDWLQLRAISGLNSELEVIQAEQQRLEGEQRRLQLHSAQIEQYLALHKALALPWPTASSAADALVTSHNAAEPTRSRL